MNRIDALRLSAVLVIILYISYQLSLEYQRKLSEAGEFDTVIGVTQIAVDVNATVFFEPVVLGLAVLGAVLVWPYAQPPY